MKEEVRYTLGTDGWTKFMVPKLLEQLKGAMDQIVVPLGARPEPKLTDDFLRGYYQAIQFALNHWEGWIKEQEAQEKQREKENSPPPPAAGSPYGVVDGQIAAS
jgi:hypothetical protein